MVHTETQEAITLGFSFGRRKDHPGTCNMRLIQYVLKNPGCKNHVFLLQKELEDASKLCAPTIFLRTLLVFSDSHGNPPLTKEMARIGVKMAYARGYKTIYILAFPFIHRFVCWYFVKKYAKPYNIRVEVIKTGYISFDQDSDQWLARGPVRLICYTILRACGIRWL